MIEGTCKNTNGCRGILCQSNSYCTVNTDKDFFPATHKCVCHHGYELLDGRCQNIDECAIEAHNCGKNADCIDTPGSYECNCKVNYAFEDGGCALKNHKFCSSQECDSGRQCYLYNSERVACSCLDGYKFETKRNGALYCSDVDECSLGVHQCDQNAECVNIDGSYDCICKNGYLGNGRQARPKDLAFYENNCLDSKEMCLTENCQYCEKLNSMGCRALQPKKINLGGKLTQGKSVTVSGRANESGQINSKDHTRFDNTTYTLIWFVDAPINHVIDVEFNPDSITVNCEEDLLELYDSGRIVRGYTNRENCARNYTSEQQRSSYTSVSEELIITYRRGPKKIGEKDRGFEVKFDKSFYNKLSIFQVAILNTKIT